MPDRTADQRRLTGRGRDGIVPRMPRLDPSALSDAARRISGRGAGARADAAGALVPADPPSVGAPASPTRAAFSAPGTRPDLRALLAAGPLIGAFAGLRDPGVAGILASAGFGVILVDREHGVMSAREAQELVTAAHAAGVPAIVRIPEALRSAVQDALEAGADGILAPSVESREQAEAIASWCRYAPGGTRGLHPVTAANEYGRVPMAEHLRRANTRVVVGVQIETAAGLRARERIVTTPGVDLVVHGPADLAASLGVPPGSDAARRAEAQVRDATDRAGRWYGDFALTEADAHAMLRVGVRLVLAAADAGLLAGAGRALVARIRAGAAEL